ncbi:MAG TPA: GNAT family protein [Xanthobacteraceae bacterium]|nr:GNAT family protein [Xanthobacteraceae bacterium]
MACFTEQPSVRRQSESEAMKEFVIKSNQVRRDSFDFVDDGKIIGEVWLLHHSEICELGYVTPPAFRGQGVATLLVKAMCDHAFGKTDAQIIEAFPAATNKASIRVLEKNGFQPAAEHKEGIEGLTHYSLSKADWLKTQPVGSSPAGYSDPPATSISPEK